MKRSATAGRPTQLDVGASNPHQARLHLEAGDTRDILLPTVRGRLRVPALSDVPFPIHMEPNLVVEFYSR